MLVLRKEFKIGIGAALVILGIGGVYGLMASLSGGPKDQTAVLSGDEKSKRDLAIDGAHDGLPPKDIDPIVPIAPAPKPVDAQGDPFAESKRTDGNPHNDVWNSALTTGRVSGDLKTTGSTAGPTVVKAPTAPRVESKLVDIDPPAMGEATTADGSTAAKAKSTPDTSTAAGGKYVIQAGDTFSKISEKVYGSKRFYSAIAKANPDVNPSRMRVGHEITVPPKEQVASVGGAIETDRVKLAAPIDATKQYRIAPGDTLSRISQKLYGKSTMWSAIYESNKTAIGPNEAKLKVGTLLDLPQKPVR